MKKRNIRHFSRLNPHTLRLTLRHILLQAMILMWGSVTASADEQPFRVTDALAAYFELDQNTNPTLGLEKAPGLETVTVFTPSESTNHYSNGVVMTVFKGVLYVMWQSSATDEDANDSWVAYARSTDGGQTWTAPMTLCKNETDGSHIKFSTSGGWLSTENKLVAYINTWEATDGKNATAKAGGYTRYMTSEDGLNWTTPQDVKMADGTTLFGVIEQDPHVLNDGRIICAAHFMKTASYTGAGKYMCPIYTDDPTGISGWKKAQFTSLKDMGSNTQEMEPSFYQKPDGMLVMAMRDQSSSYFKLASVSNDRGESWTEAVKTNVRDSRAKQSCGNLPDGTAFQVNNPVKTNKPRVPLALITSADGTLFDKAWLLRGGDELPAQQWSGYAKTLGYSYPKSMVYDGYLYVSYSTQKELVEYTRIPLTSISTGMNQVTEEGASFSWNLTRRQLHIVTTSSGPLMVTLFSLSSIKQIEQQTTGHECLFDLSPLPAGTYILSVQTSTGRKSVKVLLKEH